MMDQKADSGGLKSATKPNLANATRDDILRSAAELIATQGYSACTMRAISDRVNIKAGSVYYYFQGKQEIVFEIMNRGVEMMRDAVEDALSAVPPDANFKQKLRAAVKAHIGSKIDRNTPFMQVYEHLTPAIKREGADMRRQYARLWFELFDEGIRRGEIRASLDRAHFISFLLSGLNRAPEWLNPDHMTLDAATDLVMDLLLHGVFAEGAATA